MASAGCRKNAGVPVLVSVAAILRQMMPDLPIPVTITRPAHCLSSWTAASNLPSTRLTSARIAAASVSSTLRASARSAIGRHLGLLHDPINGDQALEQRLEPIESERVLRVAHRPCRLFVHLEEHAVHA